MSSRELSEWQAYDRLEPIGDKRGDYQAALVAMVVTSVFGGKSSKAPRLEDFLLQFDAEPKREQSPETLMAAFALATGAT